MATATRDAYPQIIAHRGASGYIPEHSLQAYQTAMDLLTDYIEPDLCLTKDGVFVAMHDVLLDDTTNVADLPQFASYKTTKNVEGLEMTGWFVSDFTHAETQQLTLKQRLSFRTPLYNGVFRIPSLDLIIGLAQSNFNATSRLVGIYMELKQPLYFRSLGWDMEGMLLSQLTASGFLVSGDAVPRSLKQVLPIVIQCFDKASLERLRPLTAIPLVQLLEAPTPQQLTPPQTYWTETFLDSVATYADAIGPEKSYFSALPLNIGQDSVAMAHSRGLALHPWTFRAEAQFIGAKFAGDFQLENAYFYCCLGMDGLFTEFPDRSREVADANVCPIDCAAVNDVSL